MSLLTIFIQHSFRCLAIAIREEKEVKGIQNGKEEVELSIFAEDMILYIEDPKDAIRKLLELISEFGKVAGYKITHRNLLYFYTLTAKDQKEKFKKQFYLSFHQKRIKYLGINLPKETKTCVSKTIRC